VLFSLLVAGRMFGYSNLSISSLMIPDFFTL